MKNLKENKPLRFALGALLFIILCCFLPQQILFLSLCLEQDREIPPHTEVLVSACKRPVARGVPGGEVVFVYEGRTGKTYFLDLQTGKRRRLPDDPLLLKEGVFLSSELIWLEGSSVGPYNPDYRPHYVLDLKEGKQYELLDLTWAPLKDGKFNIQNYSYFQSAENIFINHEREILIAMPPDFRNQPGESVIFEEGTLGIVEERHQSGTHLDALMQNLGLNYTTIDLSLEYTDVPSPTGRYTIKSDGIYEIKTGSIIMTPQYAGRNYSLKGYFKGWYYDETGIVVQEVEPLLFSHPFLGSYYIIPKPVLKLLWWYNENCVN
ncbi:hypothetical protein FBQ83_06730 [Chloroflexi bacterium CFX5]|nr:hypothetical protein [Chloroflexota bacterium]MDL1919004.1 hypothetical protein [Chloroflexi bacterium CFX5]